MPLFFSANAPKPNTFATDSTLSSFPIRLGPFSLCICNGSLGTLVSLLCTLSGTAENVITGTIGVGVFRALGVVLRIPRRGRFICPFAVAGLGLRYLRISFSLIWGHPLRNPCRVAFNSVDIFGLHNYWCANFTLFACVRTECKNIALSCWTVWGCRARLIPGQGCVLTWGGPHPLLGDWEGS
jgi:hypothetical protein